VNGTGKIVIERRQNFPQLACTDHVAGQMKYDVGPYGFENSTNCDDVPEISLPPLKMFAL
jgi:hypothetical protein